MKVLFAASESVPFCKTGGLADMVGALLPALKQKRHDVRLVLPRYRGISPEKFGLKRLPHPLHIPLGDTHERVVLWEGRLARHTPVYFVDCPKYFDREDLYRDTDGSDYADNDERFVLFSRAVLETAKAVDFRPDVVHCHDWQTGLVPALLQTVYRYDGFFLPTASLFTVHNIAYQGQFPKNTIFLAGFSWADFTPDRLEYYDQVNFLKAGLVYAEQLSTVSPAYAQETLLSPEFGRGMEGILRLRAADYHGVLNGLDEKEWDPARDRHLVRRFTAARPEARAECKADLQRAARLEPDPAAPLFGLVSRLDPQKGIDMVLDCIEAFLTDGAQFVALGQGGKEYQAGLEKLADSYPGRVRYSSDFDETLAHKIYGGCDLFLMPSRFEPCGLAQMIALRYGAVPVVTPTGGLLDTVPPVDTSLAKGLGFVATSPEPGPLHDAMARAVELYRDRPDAWRALVKRGMSSRFGWSRSVDKYVEIYRAAAARKADSLSL
jgi:starch synthase